jgi:hypothetical protein
VSGSGEPPWLQQPLLEVARWIVRSHQAAFGSPLLAGVEAWRSPRLVAQELFAADRVVLAHDGGTDPRLIYANAAALRLWKRPWTRMIGLPSRLTAEPKERNARAKALALAQRQEALRGYAGIRVDSTGVRFQIDSARLWTLRDDQGESHGQAASFGQWWRLSGAENNLED